MFNKIKAAVRCLFGKETTYKKCSADEDSYDEVVSINSVAANGFMRDYRLVSQIDPVHFIVGGSTSSEDLRFTSNRDLHAIYNRTVLSDNEDSAEDTAEDGAVRGILTVNPDRTFVPDPLERGRLIYQGPGKHDKTEGQLELPVSKTVAAVEVTPKSVLTELGTVPKAPADMVNLDAKLETYLRIHELIRKDSSRGNRETIVDVIERLRNRKKFAESLELQQFFGQYQCTTDAMINVFMSKYAHLKIGPADDFIPEFPADAHATMLAYADKVVSMCNHKPVFYVIAMAKDFKTKDSARKRRDPILLVQAPIGFYWQILGAWDEEMRLVTEL